MGAFPVFQWANPDGLWKIKEESEGPTSNVEWEKMKKQTYDTAEKKQKWTFNVFTSEF
jgi:hypothetical protein